MQAELGKYKIPVGRGGGGHSRQIFFSYFFFSIFFPLLQLDAINPTTSTYGRFVLSPVLLALRDQWRPVELNDRHLRSHGKIGDCKQCNTVEKSVDVRKCIPFENRTISVKICFKDGRETF